jgi:hypothetical protein
MKSLVFCFVFAAAVSMILVPDSWAEASDEGPEAASDGGTAQRNDEGRTAAAPNEKDASAGEKTASQAAKPMATPAKSPGAPPAFDELLKDAKVVSGLFKMYLKETKLYAEIPHEQLDKDFVVIISIARGIGRRPVFGGMSWNFGDAWIWQFRKADDRMQVVRRNVRFRATKGTPQEESVYLAYTDSVLFSLPIAATAPSGAPVVELTSVFKSDLPQISTVLPGFTFSQEKSSWAAVKGFSDNVEIEVAATYTSSGTATIDSVADTRGATIHVHYSISRLPETGYRPRPADDRVGYFLTALMDYSKDDGYDRFVRYVNRWDLQKAEPSAKLSPPKDPIVFWIEKTVPFRYRKAIREGILQWNRAFEKAGFANAIEVRQQPADATWDPEDINYNTFRWITASAGFAIGPNRVNPLTGQVLDADILFDADFLQRWKEDYEIVTPDGMAPVSGGPLDAGVYRERISQLPPRLRHEPGLWDDQAGMMARQLLFGSLVMGEAARPMPLAEIDELLEQAVRATTMHEVGHTLGLRHNFKASAYLTLEDLDNPEKTRQTGLAASVMDYLPMNVAPPGKKQGDYFTSTIGPYDYWAIEYGYKPCAEADLSAIASRCAEPGLDFGTDEDSRGFDPDPLTNRYDLGRDPILFAQRRVEVINAALPGLVERMTKQGEDYHQARRAFNILLGEHANAMHFTARFIGGVYANRDHKGDPNARPPFVVVERAKQDEAMKLLEKEVFGPGAYQFSPALYNYLGHEKWAHWGTDVLPRIDYPIHDIIGGWQDRVLDQLLATTTLARLLDSELKLPPEQEAFTVAELLPRLTAAVFSELGSLKPGDFTDRRPAVGSLRRSLQARYAQRLAQLALGNLAAPEDCRSLAFVELDSLRTRIEAVLGGEVKLDPYTRAHLRELSQRIAKVLDAQVELPRP